MRKIIEKLSSMHLTLWTLVFLILWVGSGIYLSGMESFTKEFRIMNNILVRDWLFSDKVGTGTLKVWFLILCAAMTVIGINLIFCSWSKIFRIMRAKFSASQLFMLLVHAIFGFVALGHLGGLMLGFEYNNISLSEGKAYKIAEGYQIEVNKIHFAGNLKALKNGKMYITRQDLDHKESYAEVSLIKGEELLKTQKIYLLKPMSYRDIHVTLDSFILPDDLKGDPTPETSVWCRFALSSNPALKSFLTVYPIMIAGIFIYLIMTWRKSHLAGMNGK